MKDYTDISCPQQVKDSCSGDDCRRNGRVAKTLTWNLILYHVISTRFGATIAVYSTLTGMWYWHLPSLPFSGRPFLIFWVVDINRVCWHFIYQAKGQYAATCIKVCGDFIFSPWPHHWLSGVTIFTFTWMSDQNVMELKCPCTQLSIKMCGLSCRGSSM